MLTPEIHCSLVRVPHFISHLTPIVSCDVSCCRKSEHILIGGCPSVCHSLSHAVCCPINSQCITIPGPCDSGSRRASGGAGQGSGATFICETGYSGRS